MENFDQNPIVIVDDDVDDLYFATTAIKELGYPNPVETYTSGPALLTRLESDPIRPFVILCDMNLPMKNGIEVRKSLAQSKNKKLSSIPFVFWSTGATQAQINEAYELWAQGVFVKPSSSDEIQELFKTLLKYWTLSGHPKL